MGRWLVGRGERGGWNGLNEMEWNGGFGDHGCSLFFFKRWGGVRWGGRKGNVRRKA